MMNDTEPLGLPKGSVHAIITLVLVTFWCGMVFSGYDLPPDLKALASLFVGLYAGKRAANGTNGVIGGKK